METKVKPLVYIETTRATDPVEEIRAVRRRISAAHGHDAHRLVHHYQKMESQYADRMRRRAEMRKAS